MPLFWPAPMSARGLPSMVAVNNFGPCAKSKSGPAGSGQFCGFGRGVKHDWV
jgi:hypothetical protein